MNDREFDALDDRASKAASNVKAAAARRPRPVFDADQPMTLPAPVAVGQTRAPRRTAWVAAAAVVALVAGAVTFAATRPDDGKDTVAAAAVEDPRPFVADDLPDGFEPAYFTEVAAATAGDADGSFTSAMPVYGTATDRPLAGATVVDDAALPELDLESFQDDGLTLYRNAGEAVLTGQWVVVKQDGLYILVFGATDDDALVLAHAVSAVDAEVSVDVDSLPDGWRRLVTIDDPRTLMYNVPRFAVPTKSYLANYRSAGTEQSLSVTTVAGDEATMWAGRLFVSDGRELTVHGQRGFVGSYPIPEGMFRSSDGDPVDVSLTVVSWLERPGEVVSVSGFNVDEEQLLAVADSVRPADEVEWAGLVEQTQLGAFGGFFDDGDNELGRVTGTFDDGTKWSLMVSGFPAEEGLPEGVSTDPGVYTELRVALSGDGSGSQGSSSSSNDSIEGFRSVDTTDVGGRFFSSGLVGDEVARVELQTVDGSVLGDAQMVEVAKLRAYVTELTEDPTVLVALRADGSEAGRVTIEGLDENTTVDMDGNGQGHGQVSTFESEGIPVDSEGNEIIDPVQPTETTEPTGDQPPG